MLKAQAQTLKSILRFSHIERVSLGNILANYGMWLALVVMCAGFSLVSPAFLSPDNMWNILLQAAPLAVAAIGQAIVLIAGGFDLSVGSIAAMSGLVMVLSTWRFGTIAGLICGAAAGAGLGAINGALIGRWRLNALILTLGSMTAIRGACYQLTGGLSLSGNIPNSMLLLGNGSVGPVPIPVIVGALSFLFLQFFLTRTVLGRNMFAMGGNREAARLAGINLFAATLLAFTFSGFFASLNGLILTSQLAAAVPQLSPTLMLDTVAAVVIGGVSMWGGEGSAARVLAGVLFLSILRNGMDLLAVSKFLEDIATGLIIVAAVGVDRYRHTTLSR